MTFDAFLPLVMAASLESIEKFTKELYRSSNFADLTLKLKDDKEIKVHKSVVCRSSFFKSACMSGFKVLPQPIYI